MDSLLCNHSVRAVMTLFSLIVCFSTARADHTSNRAIDDGLIFLSHLTRGSALEGAGSHGSFGTTLGGGSSAHLLPERRELLPSLFGDKAEETSMSTPRLWLTKGLPIPVDLGVTLAYADGAVGASAYGQWTVFEGFRRPALALRIAEGKLFGAEDIALNSTTSEAIISFGLLKFLTVYGNLGIARHRGEVAVANSPNLALIADENTATNKVWQETIRRAGLQVGTPLFALTAETTLYDNQIRDYAAKIAFML